MADYTRLSKSFLAAEAVSAYVDRELEIIDGIRRGLADVADGTVVSHNAAMAEIYGVVNTASRTEKR